MSKEDSNELFLHRFDDVNPAFTKFIFNPNVSFEDF